MGRQMSVMAKATPEGSDIFSRRRCIATGETQPLDRLVRFVVGPEGVLYHDLSCKLPGRGIWVSGRRNLVDQAVKKHLFARAAKRPVSVPDDMANLVERGMVDRCLNFLSLAKRAGQLTLGSNNVKAILRTNVAAIVITALDGAENGRKKLLSGDQGRINGLWRSHREIVQLFTIAELSLALGRENVVHAALLAGGLAEQVLNATYRLEAYRHDKAILS